MVDSIRDFEKIAGLEEIIRCMMLVPGLNERKVIECLECEKYSSDAKRYLMKESKDNVFYKRWKLYALWSLKGLIDKVVG